MEIRRNLRIVPCGLSITTQPGSRPFHRRGRHLAFGSMQKISTAMAFREHTTATISTALRRTFEPISYASRPCVRRQRSKLRWASIRQVCPLWIHKRTIPPLRVSWGSRGVLGLRSFTCSYFCPNAPACHQHLGCEEENCNDCARDRNHEHPKQCIVNRHVFQCPEKQYEN